jgi:hypothetical protein
VDDNVTALAVFDDGSGPALYAGGSFTHAGGSSANHIARWNGSTWSALGAGVSTSGSTSSVQSLAVFDDGSGPALYAGGDFAQAGGVNVHNIAKWNGTSWSGLADGLTDTYITSKVYVHALTVFDDGHGAALYAGGSFLTASGKSVDCVARWNGTTWSPLAPTGDGISGAVQALAAFDDGTGSALYAAGGFQSAGATTVKEIAKWNGSGWSSLAGGVSGLNVTELHALGAFDSGGVTRLYAGGYFFQVGGAAVHDVAQWDGTTWSDMSGGVSSGTVYALARYDDGSGARIYAGGDIQQTATQVISGIASWDGSSWSPVGGGVVGAVRAMTVFDDGTGSALYVGGTFNVAGSVTVNYLGRWNGTSWSSVGGGTDSHVYALCAFDDGSGPALYAAGNFTHAGGVAANRVAKWNGSAWSPVGGGVEALATALAVHDDGAGKALYLGGYFTTAGGAGAKHIAKWNGTSWSAVGGGVDGTVWSMQEIALGSSTPDLYVAGEFTHAGGAPSSRIACWRTCSEPATPLCFGDGSISPCPCANNGLPGHGCDNSAATGGARLTASGTTHPDTLVLHASGEIASALSIFLQGSDVIANGVSFGDGVRCASGSLLRLYVGHASTGSVSAPAAGDPSITARSAALGHPINSGDRRYYQVYYRDPMTSFCPPPSGDNFNATHALKVVW